MKIPNLLLYSIVIPGSLLLSSCFDSNPDNTTATGAGGAISGSAYLNAIDGGTISLYNVTNDGSTIMPPLEQTTTDADGNFSLSTLPPGPFRVCLENGTYTDEASGAPITNTLTLCGLFPQNTRVVVLSMLTSFADEIAKGKLARLAAPTAADLDGETTNANAVVRDFFGLLDTANKIKPIFGPPDPAADPTGDRYKFAAILGAYSQLALDFFNNCGGVPGEEQAILASLIEDIQDSVFDGLSPLGRVFALCGGANTNLGVGAGTADLLAAMDAFALTVRGQLLDLQNNATRVGSIKTAVANGVLAPVQVRVAPSQGLIAIDAVRNVAYVPIYTQDANGDGQVAIVDLDAASTNPILDVLSLPGSIRAVASGFNALTRKVYIEGQTGSNTVEIYVVDADTDTIINQVPATGLLHSGNFGGVLVNPLTDKVILGGSSQVGVMDISVDPPVFDQTSLISVNNTDSLSLNFETELVFVAADGTNSVIDTSVSPPVKYSFPGSFGTTDGNAFDNLTNTLIVDPEFQDRTTVCNFEELVLDMTVFSSTAPCFTVAGLGTTPPTSEGPGGQAAINVLTHQAVLADEFGHNFRLMQLPTAKYTGAANNNGQPGSGMMPDAASAYSIAAAVLPTADLSADGGSATTPLGIRGDPNSLTVDPSRNFAYGLVDERQSFNSWPAGSTRPLFLIQIDLSAPVLGASPTEPNGLRWNPDMRLIRMP